MIDEILQEKRKVSAFAARKMLEVRTNRAHLVNLLLCIRRLVAA